MWMLNTLVQKFSHMYNSFKMSRKFFTFTLMNADKFFFTIFKKSIKFFSLLINYVSKFMELYSFLATFKIFNVHAADLHANALIGMSVDMQQATTVFLRQFANKNTSWKNIKKTVNFFNKMWKDPKIKEKNFNLQILWIILKLNSKWFK